MFGNPPPTPGMSKSAPTSTPPTTDRAAGKPSSPAETRNPTSLDLRSAACAAEIVSGAHGDCVKALQLLLAGYGLHVTVDGQFGEATVTALKAFQAEAGIAVNEKADAETKQLLYGMARGPVQVGSLTVTESVDGASVARCLDAHTGATGGDGLNVQVWTCNGTAVQKWALHRVPGQGSQYTVVNQGNHRCLDSRPRHRRPERPEDPRQELQRAERPAVAPRRLRSVRRPDSGQRPGRLLSGRGGHLFREGRSDGPGLRVRGQHQPGVELVLT